MLKTIPSLQTGDVATVERVSALRNAAKRLADMGFVRGAQLEVVRAGTPCIVRLEGATVGLGTAHQSSIEVFVA